jgi:hypothetical protein
MLVRMGNLLERARDAVVEGVSWVKAKGGLILPPEYVAGRHFGGFHKLEPWIQDCIRSACRVASTSRTPSGAPLGPDELSELTAFVIWEATECHVTLTTHKLAMEAIAGTGLTDRFKGDIAKQDGRRHRGSLLVVALRPDLRLEFLRGDPEQRGIPGYVGAWDFSSLEAAMALNPIEHVLG